MNQNTEKNNELVFTGLYGDDKLGIVVADENGCAESVNSYFLDLFGKSKHEIIGSELYELFNMLRHEHKAEGKSDLIKSGYDYLLVHASNNRDIPVKISMVSGFPGMDKTMLIVHDVSDYLQEQKSNHRFRKRMQRLVDEKTAAITQEMEKEKHLHDVKSKFVSLASNEFRTPLSAIFSSASLIDRYLENETPERVSGHIQKIKNAVHSMTDLLNDFQSLDQLEQNSIKAGDQELHIHEFIHDICSEYESNLKEGQEIRLMHQGDNIIRADGKLIRYILMNLITNASKYSDEGKNIEIETEAKRKSLKLVVRDYGIGILERDQDKMFSMFFRARNVRNTQGTGIALNIVARYVQILNGKISFRSREGEGTEFTLRIPYEN